MKIRTAAAGVASVALGIALTASPAHASTAGESIGGSGALDGSAAASKANLPDSPDASVSFAITNIQCFSNAITFRAKTQENGFSGVQQFKQTAVEQVLTTAGWQSITGKAVTKSQKFPNNGLNFSYTFNWRATHAVTGASYRVIWQGFYLNGFGQTLFKTRPIAVNCF